MSEKKAPVAGQDSGELKEYAGGWMTERKGTDTPGFLKLAFPVIGLGCTAYIVMQMMGDTGHATRGPLVEQFNKATITSPGLMYIVAALALVYVLIVAIFAIRKFHED
jgi:hypothetical protein